MPVQSALAKLFTSSSCYPFARGGKAEIRWQATPTDLFAGYERDQPKQDESPVTATYDSLHSWFIGDVREDSSQVCNPGSSRMKSKYGTEGETRPGYHIAVEIRCRGRARVVSPRDKRPGSTVFITNIVVRNAFVLSRPWRRGRSSQVRLRGRGFLPGPLRLFRSSRTLGRETAAKGGIWRNHIKVYCW
jgi:hypothetical protein